MSMDKRALCSNILNKSFFIPLLIVCLFISAAPPEAQSGVSLMGNIRKPIPPMPSGPFEPVPPNGRPNDDFMSIYDNVNIITPAFRNVREIYEKGRFRDAYLGWLKLAQQGDMFAMATLPAVMRVHPELEWPVQPEFWENWLITLLGEGEGAYALGAQYMMMADYREEGTKFAKQKAGEFFVRSALAGHHAGMMGAEETAILYRADQPFIPPPHPEVTPLPADFYQSDKTGEARYWLIRAADEGYWKACIQLGLLYENPDAKRQDYDKARHYYICAANNGSLPAATAIIYTKAGDKLDKKTYEVFHRKTPDYEFKKEFAEKFSEKEFYIYMTIQYMLSDFGRFDYDAGLTSLAREFGFRGHEVTVAAGIAEGKRIYTEWKKRYAAEQIQKAKLYAQARSRLPEVMKDYAKHAKGGDVLVCSRDDSLKHLNTLYDDNGVIAPDFQWIRQDLYECGQFREAYEGWLELAWQGDLFAMATLPAVSRVHPELQWPAPPEFWENWLIELLGEGEGAYILGAQYGMMTDYREDGTKHAEQKAGEFFLRSALAGHHAGMLGAEKTAKYRRHLLFTPPSSPNVTPIPVRFYGDDKNGEARYWLTRAANEGYWKACILMAAYHKAPKTGESDYDRVELYFEPAVRSGSYTAAAVLGSLYRQKILKRKSLCEGYYTYTPLAFTLIQNGYLEEEQRKSLEEDFREECKDTAVIDAAIRESRRLYEEGMAQCAAEMRQKEELYAKARARLPEVRAAYEKATGGKAADKGQ